MLPRKNFENLNAVIRISPFPGFSTSQETGNFPRNPGKIAGSRKSSGFPEFGKFPGKFLELNYLTTRRVTKTFFLNFSISNPILHVF